MTDLLSKAYGFAMQHRFDEAVDTYQQLLQHDPMHIRAMFDLCCIYRAMENFSEARYWLARVQTIAPEFPNLPFAWTILHMLLGEVDQAIEALEPIAEDIHAHTS